MTWRRSRRRRFGAIGWLGLAGTGLAAVGFAGMILLLLVPVERLNAEGYVVGEMPPAFGIGMLMAVAGLSVAVTAVLARVLVSVWRRRMRRVP